MNGVGGGGWDEARCRAWLVDAFPILDTVWMGTNGMHEKKDIAEHTGFDNSK